MVTVHMLHTLRTSTKIIRRSLIVFYYSFYFAYNYIFYFRGNIECKRMGWTWNFMWTQYAIPSSLRPPHPCLVPGSNPALKCECMVVFINSQCILEWPNGPMRKEMGSRLVANPEPEYGMEGMKLNIKKN